MKISLKHITQAILLFSLLPLLQSCGTESDLSFITRKIIHSSELLDTPMRTNEYVVAFKARNDYRGKWFSPKNENRYNIIYLSSSISHKASINDFQMFGRIPMYKQMNKQNPIGTPFLYTQPDQVNKSKPEEMILTNIIFRSSKEARETLEKWSKEDAIWFAEPNYINKTFQNPYADHLQEYQDIAGGSPEWYHSEIKLFEAFGELSKADTIIEPVIAILDTGIQTNHQGLAGRVWENSSENIGKAGCSNDVNGCNTGAAFRYSFGDGKVDPTSEASGGTRPCESANRDSCSHGTHVAGIVAANRGYSSGNRPIAICPVCKVMAIKAVPTDGDQSIADSAIIAGLKYISNFRSRPNSSFVRVINMSLGKSVRSRAVSALIQHLFDNLNVLVIAAAGNEDTNVQSYPASLPSVVAVASVEESRIDRDITIKSTFSNFGTWVSIAAPGAGIPSTEATSNSLVIARQGTSMASPVVAGVAGLIISQEPNLTAQQLRDRLINTTNTSMYRDYTNNLNYFIQPQGELTRRPLLGTGLLDAFGAVTNLPSFSPVPNPEIAKRVSPSCGCLNNSYEKNSWLLLWFLIPLGMILISQKPNRKIR